MKLTVNADGVRRCLGGCELERQVGFHPMLHLTGPGREDEQAVFHEVLRNEVVDDVASGLAAACRLSWRSITN